MDSASSDLTVVIPHFESPELLARALQSVAAQTLPPSEVIVVDDASGDTYVREAREVVRTYGPTARLIEQVNNGGPGVARNEGWNAARTTWVAFLDADDVWHPSKLELQRATLSEHPETILCSHTMVVPGQESDMPLYPASRAESLSYRSMLIRNKIATSSAVVLRSTSARFPESPRYCEDYSLWLTLASERAALHLPLPLGTRYASPTGLSAQLWRMETGELEVLRSQALTGRISKLALAPVLAWSFLKFVIRWGGSQR